MSNRKTAEHAALERRVAKLRRWAEGRIARAKSAVDSYGLAGARSSVVEQRALERVLRIIDGTVAS